MKIWHFSDTHQLHKQVLVPSLDDIDIIIFSGDESNYMDSFRNEQEFFNFIDWYGTINHPYKIMIAGNHSSFIATNKKQAEKEMKDRGIIYLNKESVTILGKKIYGEPTSPIFGNWHFMTHRSKMAKHLEMIPNDVNILVTHTPPKYILDLGTNGTNLEYCGCSYLHKKVQELNDLQLHCFGHIHDSNSVYNNGVLKRYDKLFSNGACVKDGEKLKLYNHGNIIKID